jgi:hypothetical protein
MGEHSCASPESQERNTSSPRRALSVHQVCWLLVLPLTGSVMADFNYSVWAPIRGPVQDWPLALCDASSLNPHALHAGDVVFQDFQTENLLLEHHPEHRWYYVREQMPTQAWVFLQGDSRGRPCQYFWSFTVLESLLILFPGVPHSSFLHPGAPEKAQPRQSIEVRALVFTS